MEKMFVIIIIIMSVYLHLPGANTPTEYQVNKKFSLPQHTNMEICPPHRCVLPRTSLSLLFFEQKWCRLCGSSALCENAISQTRSITLHYTIFSLNVYDLKSYFETFLLAIALLYLYISFPILTSRVVLVYLSLLKWNCSSLWKLR